MTILLLFGGALVWTMPAQSLARLGDPPPRLLALEGLVRQGRARLAGGHHLDWTLAPSSLLRGRIGGPVTLTGGDTLLEGVVAVGHNRFAARDVSGRVGPELLALLAGGPCDLVATVDVARIAVAPAGASAMGRIDTTAARCVLGGRAVDLPAGRILLDTDGDTAHADFTADDGPPLARARIGPARRIGLEITPEGAALAGLPSGASTTLNFRY